jgi:hypothetical protein
MHQLFGDTNGSVINDHSLDAMSNASVDEKRKEWIRLTEADLMTRAGLGLDPSWIEIDPARAIYYPEVDKDLLDHFRGMNFLVHATPDLRNPKFRYYRINGERSQHPFATALRVAVMRARK